MMHARDLREVFLTFFEERGHTRVPSASLIPHDKTLLFTVAGMVPFKPYFTGEETPPWPRAVDVQKCVRAGGKHNDLDEIGRTTRHLTFFEMLGNFSFGDYFKELAIPYAWELVTEGFGLDPERLWVTVHTTDDEAEAIWHDVVGVPMERIQRLDEDNFWQMADTGPCGPCSEIFWDKGPEHGEAGGPAFGGEERFVEIWNLVFMQYEQFEDGSRTPLPNPSIDTGAGLERILAVLQGVDSVFDTDELKRLIAKAVELTGVPYGDDEDGRDVSLRILAEHARTMTFLVSAGVIPSNEDRGYVLRRIIRRAVRHAYLLGVEEVITPALVDEVVAIMGDDYPELVENHAVVRQAVEREETRFRETLRTGSAILETALGRLGEGEALPGDVAFQLHDTYGFPLEVTQEIVAEQGVEVDQAGFDAAMAEQRQRGKADRKSRSGPTSVADLDVPETEFVGREVDEVDATVLAVLGEGDDTVIVLDRTPFYAESGGQVGDTGSITADGGRALVGDTTYGPPGVVFHHAAVEGEIAVGQTVRAAIDVTRRNEIRRNHTGTHILHWALREVLGDHVKQQGSFVGPDRLRFDFSHFEPVTAEQMAAIEDRANAVILSGEPVTHEEMSKAEAEGLGAIAFFGDKYGERVRVLQAGPSTEFCGGTHVTSLGQIGPLKVVSEGSIGSNLRRIEAVTGTGTVERLRRDEDLLAGAADRLGVAPEEVLTGLDKRLDELKALRDEVKALKRQSATGQAATLAAQAVDGVVVARVDGLERNAYRDLAHAVRDQDGVRGVVLISEPDGGGVALASAVRPDSGLHAGELIADAAKTVGGGGGKDPLSAVAGGRDAAQIDTALDQARAAAGLA